MRNRFASLCFLIIAWIIAVPAYTQQRAGTPASPQTPSAPAPKRDISGVWQGPVDPRKQPTPPMTPWGQKFFDEARPLQGPRALPIAKTNDPLVTCDPLGFPRASVYETRGFQIEHLPKRTLELYQYQRVWRDIWTDGRKLPTNVGAPRGQATTDPRYYGYSVGEWADDYTFVVHTTGFKEDIWATEQGHPRSQDAVVEERYRRVDHDHLELTLTINDPKSYTKPFEVIKQVYTWAPKQDFEEQLCIPSEAVDYRETFREAGQDK
jgi:hypothetical protein